MGGDINEGDIEARLSDRPTLSGLGLPNDACGEPCSLSSMVVYFGSVMIVALRKGVCCYTSASGAMPSRETNANETGR